MEVPPKRVKSLRCRIKRPGAHIQLPEMVATVTHVPTNHPGRVPVLVPQTCSLSSETGQEVSVTRTVAHLYGERMTSIVPLTIKLITRLMKRGGNLGHFVHNHAVTYVTAMMTGTDITITQAETALIGPLQDLQGLLPRTNLWTVCAQAIGSLMIPTLVAFIPVTVTSHLTALAVFYEGRITLFTILLTKVLGIMMTHLVVVLGQQSDLGTPNPTLAAPILSSCGIPTPRIRVQVDHRL